MVGTEFHNIYMEASPGCTNPLGNVGQAGIIQQGQTFRGEAVPNGVIPVFANTGSTDYRYYIVAKNTTFGASNALFAGQALSNGSGNITVTTPDIAGANTFDLLRVTVSGTAMEQAPFGSGNYAVATNVSRGSACTAGHCTFTDTQATLGSYTVPPITYFPLIDYWPGGLVLGTDADGTNYLQGANAILDTEGKRFNRIGARTECAFGHGQ